MTWAKSPKKDFGDGVVHECGNLHYKHVAGWNVFRIINYVASFCRKATARGTKGVLVLTDYYNNIPAHTQGNVADQLGQIALTLRNGIMRENAKVMNRTGGAAGVHNIVFAQENEGSAPYGSSQILQYSQLHISIEREEAVIDLPMLDSRGKPMVNAIGEPRFLHRVSDNDYDGKTILRILKANADKRGPVHVFVENGLSRVYDTTAKGDPIVDRLF